MPWEKPFTVVCVTAPNITLPLKHYLLGRNTDKKKTLREKEKLVLLSRVSVVKESSVTNLYSHYNNSNNNNSFIYSLSMLILS